MFWNSVPGQQIKEALKTRWWASFLQYYLICQSVLLFFLLCGLATRLCQRFCGALFCPWNSADLTWTQAMENNTWMEGEGGGVVLADLGRMSLLKMPTDLESLGISIIQHINWPFSVHPTLATNGRTIGWVRVFMPHWPPSVLETVRGKLSGCGCPEHRSFVNLTYPTYLVMFGGVGSKNKMTMLSGYC